MKIPKLIGLLLLGATIITARAESFRTDINPALIYYRAFLLAPNFSDSEREFLLNNPQNWRGQKLPPHFGELVTGYDKQLKLVNFAAQSTVPCDWGIDLSPGPETLLPHLARNKGLAQGARLRAIWALQNGRQDEARDDLLGAFALARNTSRDGTLIAALVQIASESIVINTVAENFNKFSPETLRQLADGFDAAPARGTVADCIPVEKDGFGDWILNKVLEIQKANPGNDSKAMAQIGEMFIGMQGSEDGGKSTNAWEQAKRLSGGTSEGVVNLIRETGPVYARLSAILALPYSQYEDHMNQFTAEVEKTPNPFINTLFPAYNKCRVKEFTILAKLAITRAAIEFKLHGILGLNSVNDPFGNGPFSFQRFTLDGVDRGFELKSAYSPHGYSEAMIFVEMDGPPFLTDGPKIGQPLSKSAAQQ